MNELDQRTEDGRTEPDDRSSRLQDSKEFLGGALLKLRAWDGTTVRELRKLAAASYDYAQQVVEATPGDELDREIATEQVITEVNEALRHASMRSHPAIPEWAEVVACDATGTLLVWQQEGYGVSVHELDDEEWKDLLAEHAANSTTQEG